jgi:hypothetical protein
MHRPGHSAPVAEALDRELEQFAESVATGNRPS